VRAVYHDERPPSQNFHPSRPAHLAQSLEDGRAPQRAPSFAQNLQCGDGRDRVLLLVGAQERYLDRLVLRCLAMTGPVDGKRLAGKIRVAG